MSISKDVKDPRDIKDSPAVMRKGEHFYRTSIELDSEAAETFREFFPHHGALKDFVNSCLRKFVQLHEPKDIDSEIEATVLAAIEGMQEKEEKE